MRALLVLEAGLRREQRDVRALLGERDAVIHAQQQEIARLRKALGQQEEVKEETASSAAPTDTIHKDFHYDCDVKPDLISSLGMSHFSRPDTKFTTPSMTDNEDTLSNVDSLQLSFYELGSQPDSLMSNLSTQSCNGDASESTDSAEAMKAPHDNWSELDTVRMLNNNIYSADFKTLRSQDVVNTLKGLEVRVHLESQYPHKNVLSPVKEESSLSLLSANSSPVRCNPCEDQINKTTPAPSAPCYDEAKPSPSTLLQEVRISGRNEYEDNPVLNCVNQILLRDQEDFLEEQRALRLKEQEKCKKEAEALSNKKLTKSTENLSLLNEQIVVQHSPVKGKIYPSIDSVSPENVMEQLIKHANISEVQDDHYNTLGNMSSPRKPSSLEEHLHVKTLPPALPPKPQRLLLSKSLDQKSLINSILPQLNGAEENAIEIIKNRTSLPNLTTDNDLYVISNSAIDDELLQHLQGRRIKSCTELPVSLGKSKTTTQSRENMFAPVHPTHKPQVKPKTSAPTQNDNAQTKLKDEEPKTQTNSPLKKITSTSCIKVASSVSTLINTVDTIDPAKEESDGRKTSPSVSQIVRRFEDLGTKQTKESEVVHKVEDSGDTLQKNFEEFRLDECDMDALCGDERPEGDGAERLHVSAAALEARISYENFLEATGLSQKSIVTPSRMFSNHKSVMKPKDVKHRSRVKAAVNTNGSVVRYWTEPFL